MKKGLHKKPSDFFWLMLFFSIILTILSGVTSCFLAYAPGIKCDLVTSDFGIKKCAKVVDDPFYSHYNNAVGRLIKESRFLHPYKLSFFWTACNNKYFI
ncbi:MAG TPA: hypothetical protein VGZ69_02030 [Candidatus Rhabdochlamydia sp.]|jgi:hypothetical protein|nr:hypothetical protein [Candidatus Rhabdochlamydia sp.]